MHESTPCLHCGKPLTGLRTKFCDTKCSHQWHYANTTTYKDRIRAATANKAKSCRVYYNDCKHCGDRFTSQRRNRFHCYTDACEAAQRKSYRNERPGLQVVAVCSVCGDEFARTPTYRTTCSDTCRRAKYTATCEETRIKKLLPVHVPRSEIGVLVIPSSGTVWRDSSCVCGKRFVSSKAAKYCSDRCTNRTTAHKRRVTKRGAFVEDVAPSVVYARDNYTCHLCGGTLDMGAASPQPKSPTLDHVVPLSRGGTHSYANVKAAHFRCNVSKKDARHGAYALTDADLARLAVA